MADGSIFYSVALMDNGETTGDNMTRLHRTNPEAYQRMYDASAKIARMFYWFYGRIPSVVDSDVGKYRESEPNSLIG